MNEHCSKKRATTHKHDVSCSLYDFTKNYITIKDGINTRSFNDRELKKLEEMQQMLVKGCKIRLIHTRKGGKVMCVYN